MKRVLEAELMDDVEQARAYARADFAGEALCEEVHWQPEHMPEEAARGCK